MFSFVPSYLLRAHTRYTNQCLTNTKKMHNNANMFNLTPQFTDYFLHLLHVGLVPGASDTTTGVLLQGEDIRDTSRDRCDLLIYRTYAQWQWYCWSHSPFILLQLSYRHTELFVTTIQHIRGSLEIPEKESQSIIYFSLGGLPFDQLNFDDFD